MQLYQSLFLPHLENLVASEHLVQLKAAVDHTMSYSTLSLLLQVVLYISLAYGLPLDGPTFPAGLIEGCVFTDHCCDLRFAHATTILERFVPTVESLSAELTTNNSVRFACMDISNRFGRGIYGTAVRANMLMQCPIGTYPVILSIYPRYTSPGEGQLSKAYCELNDLMDHLNLMLTLGQITCADYAGVKSYSQAILATMHLTAIEQKYGSFR